MRYLLIWLLYGIFILSTISCTNNLENTNNKLQNKLVNKLVSDAEVYGCLSGEYLTIKKFKKLLTHKVTKKEILTIEKECTKIK